MTARGHAPPDPVVVGLDDGLLRLRVLDRAVAEARRRGARIVVVHAHGPETPVGPWQDDAGSRAEAYLTRTAPDLPVDLECRAGNTTALLVGACAPGSVMVLGDRHRRLGSEAGRATERAIAEAPCPVVVVPEYRGPGLRGAVQRRAVVVGVDDGPYAGAVLVRALQDAAALGATLEAVRVVSSTPRPDAAGAEGSDPADAERGLAATLAAARRLVPAAASVPVTTEVVADRPARALLERAAGADELVVGHRRHARPADLRGPGSTARSILVGMSTPVVVLGPRVLEPAGSETTEGVR